MSDDESSHEHAKNTGNGPLGSDGGHPFLTRVFSSLSTQRRRYVLYQLQDTPYMQVDDLAVQIAAWEQDIPVDEVTADQCKRVQTDLVHSHLPKLDDYDIVDYDARSEAVRLTEPHSLLSEVLALAATIEKPA